MFIAVDVSGSLVVAAVLCVESVPLCMYTVGSPLRTGPLLTRGIDGLKRSHCSSVDNIDEGGEGEEDEDEDLSFCHPAAATAHSNVDEIWTCRHLSGRVSSSESLGEGGHIDKGGREGLPWVGRKKVWVVMVDWRGGCG